MGYYVWNKAEMTDGNHLNKADRITAQYPEVQEVHVLAASPDRTGQTVSVCVIQNGPFDAAVICYNDAEYRDFKREDGRPKRWLIFPRAKVIELCPKVAKDLMPVDLRQSP